MGAHLEAQATKMRAIFVVIALSLIATAFTSTHEEALSEATELIATMKKKGATEVIARTLQKPPAKKFSPKSRRHRRSSTRSLPGLSAIALASAPSSTQLATTTNA